MGSLEPKHFGEHFHEIFISNFDAKCKLERTSRQRNKNKDKRKDTSSNESNHLTPPFPVLGIEVEPNASKFAVFSAVRSAVLEAETTSDVTWVNILKKKATRGPLGCCALCHISCRYKYNPECRCHTTSSNIRINDNDSDGDSDSDNSTERESLQKVPQIIGAGLKSLFELIAEARHLQPSLCTKALKAVLDVIQGQSPESFKSEPNELINPLYDLLLDLATLHGPGTSDKNDANNWSAIGCSALLGLSVARGDTGKILRAVAALLMSPKILSSQNIHLPIVLSSLQRSVHSLTLGKSPKPDYFKNGITVNSKIDQFSLKNQMPPNIQYTIQPSIASDGKFLYVLVSKILLKIGSGFNGTLKGHVYASNYEFGKDKNGWIGFCNDTLYYKRLSKRSNDSVLIVNTESLTITGSAQIAVPSVKDGQHLLLFSDGESLNALSTAKDDSLVVKQIHSVNTITSFDLQLKLARKHFRTLGYANFEDEVLTQHQIQKIQSTFNPFEPKLQNDLEVANIVCGKEFGLVRSANGKVYYYGKATAIGLKSIGKSPTLKMTELIISKVASIIQIVLGHDGIHALLVNDDGSVYFTGSARRGEDGDTSKNRRQPRATKPKKISRIEGHFIVHASCNNGTSAFVTKTGKLIMFGKDTTHCDAAGYVTELYDQHITKVALGKAHTVVLNSKGHLITFGLNNKGQCGRIFCKDKEVVASAMETSLETQKSEKIRLHYDMSNMCDPDDHSIIHGKCRVCSVCKECTGYNITCVTTMGTAMADRVPGTYCACGHGDAGCSKCGACFTCIKYQESMTDDGTNEINYSLLGRQRTRHLVAKKDRKLEDGQIGSDIERDAPRVAPLPPQKVVLPTSSPVVQITCGLHHTVVLTLAGEVFTFGSNQYGQLGTGDLQPVQGLVQVTVPGLISQVAAGSNHTVLLTMKGIVYTFGNYQKGQLGRLPADSQPTSNINEMELAVQLHDNKNEVGSEESGSTIQKILLHREKFLWNCTPGIVPGIGPNHGKRASWVGASGDQTFIKIDESLITASMISKVNAVADRNTILLIPTIPSTFNCLAINRRDGTCNAHTKNQVDFAKIIQTNNSLITKTTSDDKCNQNLSVNEIPIQQHEIDRMSQSIHEARNSNIFEVEEELPPQQPNRVKHPSPKDKDKQADKILPQLAFYIDSVYGVLWVFDAVAKQVTCYNVMASEMKSSTYKAILFPEIALPSKPNFQVTRSQASLNLLACLDILTSVEPVNHALEALMFPVPPPSLPKETNSNNQEYQVVCRFESFGGGWGYSGHSVEAIRFMSDTDIILGGFGMFGGRGEYTCKIKLFDLGYDGGSVEKEGNLVCETDEVPYECPARNRYNVMLPKPIRVLAGKWYLVWVKISGPSSDCGSSGQSTVTTEDQVVFSFKSTKKANNGTDVNSGQIPSILYKVITQETNQVDLLETDSVHKISRGLSNTVTRECFESLVLLLNWAWGTFKVTLLEFKDKKKYLQSKTQLDNLVFIIRACLRLIKKYVNEIYPNEVFSKTEKSAPKKEVTIPTVVETSELLNKNNLQFNYENKLNAVLDPIPQQPLPSTSKGFSTITIQQPKLFSGGGGAGSVDGITPTNPKKVNSENLQLAECIGDVRALLIQILRDDIQQGLENEGQSMANDIFEECHNTFVSCFNAFYPTSTLKWNCLCDLLTQMDRGILHSKLLSGVLAGLCSPTVKLRSTFSLLTPVRECKSVVSPSDNSGLPMLTSTEHHMYPVLVEQMIYRTQQEKCDFAYNSWTFKDVLVRLLDIVSYPIRSKIENAYSNRVSRDLEYFKAINQGLIDNCCNLLARVLAEIVYQSCTSDFDISLLSTRSLHSTGCRFARCDLSRTWNTGNFGPDAIAFTVDRPGIAIAGAMVYSGSGNYEYQLELLYDTLETKSLSHRWEILESVSGSYDQDAVQNEMAEIKFDRPVHIKEKTKYAMRLCSQGARTCSGDNGLSSIRGPCGTTFVFYPCDLSFNGTTPARGQIPCILYYSTPMKNDAHAGKFLYELHARDTALHIASDITKRCSELLIIARNAIALSITPSDKSPNSSNNTQTVDSEHNITPTIEEHLDISWTNNLNNSSAEPNNSTARDFTKKIESISKGIMESLKLDKRTSKPFEYEIEIGSTDINSIELLDESDGHDEYWRNGKMSKINGNNRYDVNDIGQSDSDDSITQISRSKILEMFEMKDSSLFHTLLPLIFAHIGPLVNSDPKSSVQVLSLIKEIMPHVAALNQLYISQDSSDIQNDSFNERINKLEKSDPVNSLCTTSNHFCIIECDHPYKSASISTYRLQFPPCVQWFSIEFDPQSGTAQPEDTLLIQIPNSPISYADDDIGQLIMNHHYHHHHHSSGYHLTKNVEINQKLSAIENAENEHDWLTVKTFNTASSWPTNAIIFPGNRIQISLETASEYLKDQKSNHFGFKCLIIGYDNPSLIKFPNFCLIQLEHELAYLGGMCSANLMKKDLILPDDKMENLYSIEDTLSHHSVILAKGLALPDSLLTINQVLDSQFPKGGQSNERQFLKDFVTGAPGSSGARLAAWLQPEPRLDPNRCELKQIPEPVRYGWPTSLTVITRDQYGDNVFVPDLKIEIKAVPAGAVANVGRKLRKSPQADTFSLGGMPLPPKMSYEPTIKEKACFNAITFMKVYQQYSFEELRFSSPIQTRVTETMVAHDLGDGTFGATWTPNSVGSYCITVTIDGIPLEEVIRVEVKEAGILPLSKGHKKNSQPPNRIRKFISKNSSGLRIRSHPTLQSEQVGIIKLNGILTFIDEIENDDGVWVRLSTESIRQHCTPGWYPTEAWCLQYNQHLGKTLLHPVIESQTSDSGSGKTSVLEKIKKTSETQIDILDADHPGDTQKISSGSLSKKGFEFTTSKFTPPLSVESASLGSAPFVFSSNYSSTRTSPKILTTSKDSEELMKFDLFDERKSSSNKENRAADSQSSADQFFLSGSPSQSNIGNTIAGVVGGGASKLQALQKWFKGDSLESKDVPKRRNDLPDFPSVSVRDLVKAIGGQDARNNGNMVTPPLSSLSSSPVAIPLRQRELHSNQSSGSKSAEISDTSALVSSLTRDLSQSSIREDDSSKSILEQQTSESEESLAQTAIRGSNFTIGQVPTSSSSSSGAVTIHSKGESSSLKMSQVRKLRCKRSLASGVKLIDMRPDEAGLPADFNLGPGFNFNFDALGNNVAPPNTEEGNKSSSSAGSDKLNNPLKWPVTNALGNNVAPPNTEEGNKSSSSAGSDKLNNPLKWPVTNMATDKADVPTNTDIPKRALPPSLAETLRAVFAAFLWHEGIVHDAMACASFLKFHPTLPKQGAVVVTRGDNCDTKLTLSKEERAQQRHSVEVANAGSYLNIRPSTLETLTKSGNSSIHNRRYRKSNAAECDPEEKSKLQSLPEIITVLPPALRSLVYLWEQLCNNCVQLVQSNALDQFQENNANAERQSTTTTVASSAAPTTDNLDNNLDKDFRNVRKKKKEDTTFCELCETFIPIPVTHHMRTVHPGCGKSSKGKGYNSVGNYCAGWAGNCGEGGKGASSWYLICDKCREKYMNGIKNSNNVNVPVPAEQFISPTTTTAHIPIKPENLFGLKTSLILNSEIYTMMKDNALFLLELSSTTSSSLATNQKKSPQQMPMVSESHINNLITDFTRPSTSRNSREIKLKGTRVPYATSTQNLRKSSNLSASVSPELLWAAPEVFSCLDALGATVTNELPYEIFGFHDNGYERPLSDMSFESVDPNSVDVVGPQQSTGGGTLSKFHRSLSMGQGWSLANQSNKFYNQQTSDLSGQDQMSRVVLRRKHHNTEGKDTGNLLLCYPSANLRKIVPESIITASCIAPSSSTHSQRVTDNPTIALKHLSLLEDGHNSNLEDFNISDYNELKNSLRANSIENNSEPIFIEPIPRTSEKVHSDEAKCDEPDENSISLLSRPSMAFILQQHDLEKLRNVMKRSLRIATCRIYSLQALNWMMKSVTQANCLHDLMWWFIAALTHSTQISNIEENLKVDDAEPAFEHPVTSTQNSGKLASVLSQSLHSYLQTVADLTLLLPAGSALQRIAIQCFGIRFRQADHQFLHRSHVFSNISKILSKSDEHDEDMLISSLHESNSNVLSVAGPNIGGVKIFNYIDLQGLFEVTVSSRQALANSLIDNSTETFWESDEEDRNKAKIIEISLSKLNYVCKLIYVHVDNSRDIGNKVSHITFYAGQSLGDTNHVRTIETDAKTSQWIQVNIKDDTATHFRLEFRGPENTLRVRQIKLLGYSTHGDDSNLNVKYNPKLTNAYQIQQRNCEGETLRVFRLITGQVFGKLIVGTEQSNIDLNIVQQSIMETSSTSLIADSLDMREHMVGILFSRSKLSHLQKQVIVHIVHAIRKEAQRAKEEWDMSNTNLLTNIQNINLDQKSDSGSEHSRAPDIYCFEMLSMVLALSGSVVGRSYLSHQHGLLKDLLSLLHTGSDRVQRQVTALLRRMLPEISPESLGELLCVQKMPPPDFSIAHHNIGEFDMTRLGILDIFLAVIAKSLQLQVKVKTQSTTASKNPTLVKLTNCIDITIHNIKLDSNSLSRGCKQPSTNPFEMTDLELENEEHAAAHHDTDFEIKKKSREISRNLNQRWFLKGTISVKQAENIIGLIRDMTAGKLTEKWSLVTKAAIAESILNLTRLDEVYRTPDNCIKTATLWLALASLCVLDRDHVEKLSSAQWSKACDTRPLCTNHDDGTTPAVIQCDPCGALCNDCDRFLHLSRKSRNHHRTVCKEEEEAIRVELHESCGRTKLFWLLALADSKTLKAMVEFRDGNNTIISEPPNSVGRCRFCGVTGNSGLLAVGNVCADAQCQEYAENACVKIRPCGHGCGGVAGEQKCLPCLQHTCHAKENETAEVLKEPKLTQDADDMCMICFTEALSCAPSIQLECGHVFHFHCCKAVIVRRWSGPRISFGFSQCPICKTDIAHSALTEILEPINTLKNDVKRKALMRMEYEGLAKVSDHKDLASYAMDRFAYYVCFKCQKAYYGGEARCDAEMVDKYNPQELVCGGCSDVAQARMCPKHGTDFLEYKCRYCCSVAVFFCFGTTHFCDTCHDDFQHLTNIPKIKLPRCPAGPKASQLLGEDCPLHIVHPATGEEFALGCGICRNAQTF